MVEQRGLYEKTCHNSVEIERTTKAISTRQCLIERSASPDFNCYKGILSSEHSESNLPF